MKIKRQALHNIFSSCATWQNLNATSSIKWIQLNSNNLHQSVSFELLIEDETTHRTVTPNFAYVYACSSTMQSIVRCFEKLNCLDISILESLVSSSSKLISTSTECLKVRFRWKNRENHLLNFKIYFRNCGSLIWQSIGSFRARFWVRLCFFS